MNEEYRVDPEVFWSNAVAVGMDGYDRMEPASHRGWHAVPSWGRDGWDLGSWPLVVIYHRERDGACFELCENVEGDVTVYRFPTEELRSAATDELAFFHWKHEGESWVEGIETIDQAPPELRGPFSWARLERETAGAA